MAFYKKRATFHTIENTCEPLLLFLRQNCHVVKEEDGTAPLWGVREAFYADKEAMDKISTLYKNINGLMRIGHFIEVAPLNYNWSEVLIFVLEDKETFTPTISKSHVRLPKLSHLITLTPEDFFAVFRILASGKNTGPGTSLIISNETQFSAAIAPFFITNDKTYRTNPEYTDRKWTRRDDIAFIAALDPTRDNQLSAMQYLTARQNPDLMYFPVDSAVQLELEWDQVSEDYVIPQSEEDS